MLFADFKRLLMSFADHEADIDLSKGTLLVQIRDEVIEAKLAQRAGVLLVEEQGEVLPASTWIINRVARIPLLADRILSYTPQPENFVTPSAWLLDQPDLTPSGDDTHSPNASQTLLEVLGRRPAGTTSVLYLTSDAGEGKTTLINHIARVQAANYKSKQTDWLLIPIPLGGRTFLRFDDVVIAALVNRFRFQLFYFDAFLELVRLGVVVPAFDGFEEMIIESSPGEAISALGNLVRDLRSSGSLLIAARKAYFDYRSFRTQARLFDAIGSDSVAFGRLSLNRWSREQFLAYASMRGVPRPEEVYDAVANRVTTSHPLLTRAVLVRRLVDISLSLGNLNLLLDEIGHHPQDYFFQFVNALVEREAHEKWLDQSGEAAQPLLTVTEHHELLASLSQEMWYSSVDALRGEVVGVVADLFAESTARPPGVARQIRERLKQHSLLVATPSGPGTLAFDHEDFRVFYLGEAIGRVLAGDDLSELTSALSVNTLPKGAVDEAVLYLDRHSCGVVRVIEKLSSVAAAELPSSFVKENAGSLAIAALDDSEEDAAALHDLIFPPDAFRGRRLVGVSFIDCYFHPTSLTATSLRNCTFVRCRFERIEVGPEVAAIEATLDGCDIGSVQRTDYDDQLFDPEQTSAALSAYGFTTIAGGQEILPLPIAKPDEELWLLERVFRIFIRSTQVNEAVIRTRLGVKANPFFDDVLPDLLQTGILQEIKYLGSGSQRRFKIGVPMARVQQALANAKGEYRRFLSVFHP